MLVNLSEDQETLKILAEDDSFLEALLLRITVCHNPKIKACFLSS